MNNLLFVLEILLSYFTLLLLFKKHQKEGIYIWLLAATILLNFMLLKKVEIANVEVNLGIVLSSVIFIGCNIINQKYGPEEIKKIIYMLLFGSLVGFLLTILFSKITASDYNIVTNNSYDLVFGSNIRLYISNMIALLFTLILNNNLYYELRKIKNKIYISNILSTIIVQFIECILFVGLAYMFTESFKIMTEVVIWRYLIKLLVCLLGTVIIYLAVHMQESRRKEK